MLVCPCADERREVLRFGAFHVGVGPLSSPSIPENVPVGFPCQVGVSWDQSSCATALSLNVKEEGRFHLACAPWGACRDSRLR